MSLTSSAKMLLSIIKDGDTVKGLCKRFPDGTKQLKKDIEELKKAGYISIPESKISATIGGKKYDFIFKSKEN